MYMKSLCAVTAGWVFSFCNIAQAGSLDGAAVSPTTAIPVSEFLGSLGVNTHVSQGYNYNNYVPALQYLGIHNIRDGAANIPNFVALSQQTGAVVDIFNSGDLQGLLSAGRTLAAANALLSLEGPNEPNNFPITYDGQVGGGSGTWVPVAEFQKDIYTNVSADPVLSGYPVFHVSEGGAETDNVGMQWLSIPFGSGSIMPYGTQYADYANTHNYVSGNCGVYIDNVAWQAAEPKLNGCWDGVYGEYHKTWAYGYVGPTVAQLPSMPRVTTETGWDSVSNPGGEPVQGKVLVNTYLDQFDEGWSYTFIYELGDGEGGGGNQGLFHTDWTPKLSATYIHNLTTVLADPGAPTPAGAFTYSIPSEPDTVHDMLMEKSNGVFELAVWGEQVQGTNSVLVKFGGTAVSTVNVYDVTLGSTPVQTFNQVKNVTLTLSDHAMIVEIFP
jgi:hypothetical protein